MLSFSRNSRSVLGVCFADMVRSLGRSSALVLLPIYFLVDRHVSFILIGTVIGASYLLTVPFGMMGGTLSDRVGRRPLFTVLPVLSASVFVTLSIEIFTGSPLKLIFLTFVFTAPIGVLQGTVDSAVLSDITLPGERMRAFSVLRLASNIGFSLGPALGGLVSLLGYGMLLIIPAAGNLVEEVVYIMLVKESLPQNETGETAVPARKPVFAFPSSDRPFILLVGALVVAQLCLGQWGTTLTLFLSGSYHLNAAEIGFMYSLNGIIVVLFQLPVSRLIDGFRELNRMIVGVALYAVSFLVFGIFSAYPLILTAAAILTMGENIYYPTANAMISKMAPQNRRGEYFGAYSAISGLAAPMIVLFGALLLTALPHDFTALWGIVAAVGLTACLMFLRAGKAIPPERLS